MCFRWIGFVNAIGGFDMQNNDEVSFMKRDDQKVDIHLNANLRQKCVLSTQYPDLNFAVTLPLLRITWTVLISKVVISFRTH